MVKHKDKKFVRITKVSVQNCQKIKVTNFAQDYSFGN